MAHEPNTKKQGQPRGLYTLFFTEMWERFSYYGMRALLVLFMVDAVATGGLGLDDKTATAIYGLYCAGVYLAALPGGWAADRLFGAQRAVWIGGIIIAAGHFTLAIPDKHSFYFGLVLLVVGTGLLKPNISAIVGQLYPEGGARRDAGFTIFYMGINLGAAIGPLICSALGEKMNWHYGFGAAGVGMIFGLIQYKLTVKHLGEAGKHPDKPDVSKKLDWTFFTGGLGIISMLVVLTWSGVLKLNALRIAQSTAGFIVAVAVLYFAYILIFYKLDKTERKRIGVIAILFIASAMFWSGFEQAGSSLNLFAERFTDRVIGEDWFTIPAGWFQSLNPVFIITLAPVVAWIWISLAKRNLEPSLPVKFAMGLFLLGMGFLTIAIASISVAKGIKVLPVWLITTYLLHSVGELCLSPVGLSSVTKLAPKRLVGQMMGVWFLATSLGNLFAGLLAGQFRKELVDQMSSNFFQIVLTTCGTALLLIIFTKPIKRLMHGVK